MGFTRRQWLASLAATQVFAAEEELLASDPPLRRPTLLAGEALVEDGESKFLPTIRAWDINLAGGARVDATTESVGDGVAACYYFEAAKPGRIVHERTTIDEATRASFKGLSFWTKGDDHDARALLTLGDLRVTAAAPFEVHAGEWRKVFVPWSSFEPAIEGEARHLGFSLDPRQSGARSFLVDRLRLYSTAATEHIEPTARRDAPGDIPADRFVDGRQNLRVVLSKFSAKQPATILFTGDSVTAGAQLYYTVPPARDPIEWEQAWISTHLFALQAAQAVAQRLGYAKAAYQFERWAHGKKEWVHVLRSEGGLEPRYDPTPWGDKGLRTVVYGAGGQESRFAVEHAAEMLAHRPDLVVYQFAGNDAYNKRNIETYYIRYVSEFLSKCRDSGAEAAIVIPAPLLNFSEERLFREGEVWAERLRRFARENAYAVVDARAAFLARGLHHAGDLYSDWAHPNHRGHRLLARLVEEMLAPSGLTVWDDLP